MSICKVILLLICLLLGCKANSFEDHLLDQIEANKVDQLTSSIATLRGLWSSYLTLLNNSDNSTLMTDLCFSNSTNEALHELLNLSSLQFEFYMSLRLSNTVIRILASIGECGFQESFEAIYRHCQKRTSSCIRGIPQNLKNKWFQMGNAILEIVDAFNEIIENNNG